MFIKKLQHLFVKVVGSVEENNAPFKKFLQLFAGILFLRLALEFFSSGRLFRLDDILHIGLWFIFIVLAFLIQLHLFSGQKILKVARLVMVFFSIALTAPIIDLIISGGMGAKMNYLSLNSLKDIWWSYITIGGSSMSRGATIGIRVEIVLLVIASFNYVRTKRNSIALALLSAFVIYSVLFMSGAVPLFLGYVVSTFHLQYQHDDQSTVLLLLTLDVFLLLFALHRHSPKRISVILKAVPWGMVMLAILCGVIGAILAVKNYPGNWKLTPTTLFWFPLMMALVMCIAGYLGILLMKADTRQSYENSKSGLLVILLIISSMISARTFFTVGLLWGLIYLLYEPPLRLIKVPLLRNLLGTAVFPAAALIGFTSFDAPMIGFPAIWIAILFGAAFFAGLFTELANREANVFTFFHTNADAKGKMIKSLCIGLLLAGFIFTWLVLIKGSKADWLFFIAAVPPALLIWFKPAKTQYIMLGLVPAFIILLLQVAAMKF